MYVGTRSDKNLHLGTILSPGLVIMSINGAYGNVVTIKTEQVVFAVDIHTGSHL